MRTPADKLLLAMCRTLYNGSNAPKPGNRKALSIRSARSSAALIAALLIIFVAVDVRAQSQFQVPPPSGQENAPIAPRKPSTPPRPGATLELPPAAPPSEEAAPPPREESSEPVPDNEPPEPEAETRSPAAPPIALPEIFRGCWQGVVRRLDSIQRLPGARPIGPWVAKTYRLCYRRVGNGPFELTFADAGMKRSKMVTNPQGRLQVLSTDGRSYAQMRALLHFDEYRAGSNRGETFGVDELTNLAAQIDAGTMRVQAKVYGERDGAPWFRASWHADFVHTPD